ncbi:MAG: hypothetical protein ACTS4T_01555 [Candidatus Hodgkinia cicadicola]
MELSLWDIDIFNRTMYACSAISEGGIIFTYGQSFQHIVDPNDLAKLRPITLTITSDLVERLLRNPPDLSIKLETLSDSSAEFVIIELRRTNLPNVAILIIG